MESFNKMLFDRKPSIWLLQETKRKINDPKIHASNIVNYQVFELRREKSAQEGGKGLNGGGLAVGALYDLNPMLISQGSDEVECITIEVNTEDTRLRCIVGYGPQISDSPTRKELFWDYIDQEVVSAKEEGVGLIIEIDSNAWLGKTILPKDPNIQNSNGKLVEKFLERNPTITLVNGLPLCEGSITRKRISNCLNEESILDLFMVCERVLPHVVKMHVDEKGENQLTNFMALETTEKLQSQTMPNLSWN